MFNFKNALTITKKELKTHLDNPALYIVVVAFLVVWQFMFFRNVFLAGEASLKLLYELLPWLMLVLIPAITMGSIAKERDDGTLENILTHPIRELELVADKFLGAVAFVTIPLLFPIGIAAFFSQYSVFDWGVFGGQLLGSLLCAAALISLGIFASGLFSNQIASLVVAAGSTFLLILIGSEFITMVVPLSLAPILGNISILTHIQAISRGVLDLRDLWYFLSFMAIFLSLTYLGLLKRKFGNQKLRYASFQMGIVLFIGIAVLTNILGDRIPGRADLTQGRIYTLSASTKNTLSELNDIVTVNLYVSELPAQHLPVLRETKDLLYDYQTTSHGNIKVSTIDPTKSEEGENDALYQGIMPIQFNTLNQEKFESQKGYLGISMSYAGKNETIPFVQSTADLEYQLTSLIRKITAKERKAIGFLTGHEEKSSYEDFKSLRDELAKQFDIRDVNLAAGENPDDAMLGLENMSTEKEGSVEDGEEPKIAGDIEMLVIASPTEQIPPKERAAIQEFLDRGKGALFLLESYTTSTEDLSVQPNVNSFTDFLSPIGVSVNGDMVYDLQSNETVSYSRGNFSFFVPYPLWGRTSVTDETSPVTFKIRNVVLPWASSITYDADIVAQSGYEVKKLLVTSEFSGSLRGQFTINPDQEFIEENLSQKVMAISIGGEGKGKMVDLGDSDFLTEAYIGRSPESIAFGMNIVSWLAQEESLADIKIKEKVFGNLEFKGENESSKIKYANLAGAVLIPLGYGIFRTTRRRGLKDKIYRG